MERYSGFRVRGPDSSVTPQQVENISDKEAATPGRREKFKVVAVSSNTNNFGLYGIVLIARSGAAYEAGANSLNAPKKDADVVLQKLQHKDPDGIEHSGFAELGFEAPRRLPKPPQKVIEELFVGMGRRPRPEGPSQPELFPRAAVEEVMGDPRLP